MLGLCTEKHTARTTSRWQLKGFLLSVCTLNSPLIQGLLHFIYLTLLSPTPTYCNAVSPLKVLEGAECIWYTYSCFSSSSSLLFFFFLMEHDFADSSSCCIISNTRARQTRTPLETVGCARTPRSRRSDSVRVEHLLLQRKGLKMLQR